MSRKVLLKMLVVIVYYDAFMPLKNLKRNKGINFVNCC